jgi:predicted CoA-substrate-specific enzyme activase
MPKRYVGIDVGAETLKAVELIQNGEGPERGRQEIVQHSKQPEVALRELLARWDWSRVDGAAVCGRFSRQLDLPRVPVKQAQSSGTRFLRGDLPTTVVSIGGHGFSVLELRDTGLEVFRENSRCSQGTGNFLRQLISRFDLDIEEASTLCENVEEAAPLSGRCPVILKTDMTHLANKGESRARILAGLYDAVCENVQVLIKPRLSPREVLLIGGVSRSVRVRRNFRRFLERNQMMLLPYDGKDLVFVEALGAARIAAERPHRPPPLGRLIVSAEETNLERVPALRDHLNRVHRGTRLGSRPESTPETRVVLGFDIGSTGSKVVALRCSDREIMWEGYTPTNGDPVAAAQTLMGDFTASPAARSSVVGFGATGSGREIVGSLLATCYGVESVYVLNEIAAHARGAIHYDPRVDTIFEIGGQDAKYIRLAGGRVVDAAMNEACSAGTGSFIEEQGKRFSGIRDVVHLGEEALEADCGVSLGQHCSVFMAEVIDGAVATGVELRPIVAGIYDSIIQNYLNRVKGNRSVGDVIFCQGMPFSADALAAAVARETGSDVIIPPNPGTVGALGIALLSLEPLAWQERPAVDPRRMLAARVARKETFVCKAHTGCGGTGNRCRIERLRTVVEGSKRNFTWGGGCSLWDKGTGKLKLPDLSPDPFREREDLVREIAARLAEPRGRRRIALTDEFLLKGLFPFFATFLHELGFDLVIRSGADQRALKRGIEQANVPFCAPMQQYHGLVGSMLEEQADFLFLPMLRGTPRVRNEHHAVVCPIVQGSADLLRWDLREACSARILSPVIDFGEGNTQSPEFVESCHRLVEELGIEGEGWRRALRIAGEVQASFEASCLDLGERALGFAQEHGITPVVVLGRPYTIYNRVLNSNVPAILREQGAIAIPVDCYPVDREIPIFEDVYWGHGQRNLRAAHQEIMEGKPFAVIETDGHSGDAGTKTRVEAFLHCVHQDRPPPGPRREAPVPASLRANGMTLSEIRERGEHILILRMGPGSRIVEAALRGAGVSAETLPLSDRESLRIGRRYTSGKECVPLTVTLGSLLQRLEPERGSDRRMVFLMPKTVGPCRFGVYNLLHRSVLQRLEWSDRVRVWSPSDSDYFAGLPGGFSALAFAGLAAIDMLLEGLYWTRPFEKSPGQANAIFARFESILLHRIEQMASRDLSVASAIWQAASGQLFGLRELLEEAARDYASIRGGERKPVVMLVGEIYVRCDPFSNDNLIDKLEACGLQVRFAPFVEWMEYVDYFNRNGGHQKGLGPRVTSMVQARIQQHAYDVMGRILGWPDRTRIEDTLDAAEPYMRRALGGEAVLTLGGPIHEWRHGLIDGVVSVGPLECMPSKIAEAQFFHVAEEEGLPSLSVPVNGDPVDPEVIEGFAFEIRSRFEKGTPT